MGNFQYGGSLDRCYFQEKPQRPALGRFLSHQKHDYFAETMNVKTISDISSFYREVDEAIAVLEEKYCTTPRQRQWMHHLVSTKSMVINTVTKIHSKIIKRLHTTPNLATPWHGDFLMDIPREVFQVILNDVIERNGYGHESKHTPAYSIVTIHELKKAVFILKQINGDIDVLDTKLLTLKYNNNSEVLTVTFHYGFWNDFGIPQH